MAEPLLLFHLSDLHFGLEDSFALDWVAAEIALRRPAAVAITGDLTMRARTREFDAAARWIKAIEVPVTVEPGNHDLPGYHLPSRYLKPFGRFVAFQHLVERELVFQDIAVVGLNTNVPAQWRFNWSKGCVSRRALAECLAKIDALPAGTRALVTVHHPLREAGTHGTALTRGGAHALAELARRNVVAVLSGHVHDAFDISEPTPNGPVRMIGAGTLSRRLRTTPASFNELHWDGTALTVKVRNLEGRSTPAMQIEDVPENAEPPLAPDQP
ncbi:MAG: metallophosphoesterase [Alteraurantiacibacter sp.]